jgi:hypothetical protein
MPKTLELSCLSGSVVPGRGVSGSNGETGVEKGGLRLT